jgi:hypothetical protein
MSLKMYSKNVVVSYIKHFLLKKTFTRCLSSAGCCFGFLKTLTNTIFRTTSLVRLSGSTEARL